MEKKQIIQALKALRQNAEKRNFKQSVDFIVVLKDIDLKKPDQQIDFYAMLHTNRGKKTKVCAFVGPELAQNAKEACDEVINVDDFQKYSKDKKLIKKLADEYDYFIAQANIMPQVAATFGKVLGPKAKMPNPKAGCVVPPNANLKPLVEKLQKTIRISVKKDPLFQCRVGYEDAKDEDLAEDILLVYNQLVSHTPKGENNIRKTYIKFTMSKPVEIGKSSEDEKEKNIKKTKKKVE